MRDLGNCKPPSLLAFEPAPKGYALGYLSSRYRSLLITIQQGVQGDAVPLPGRGVSPLPFFTRRRRRLEEGI